MGDHAHLMGTRRVRGCRRTGPTPWGGRRCDGGRHSRWLSRSSLAWWSMGRFAFGAARCGRGRCITYLNCTNGSASSRLAGRQHHRRDQHAAGSGRQRGPRG